MLICKISRCECVYLSYKYVILWLSLSYDLLYRDGTQEVEKATFNKNERKKNE